MDNSKCLLVHWTEKSHDADTEVFGDLVLARSAMTAQWQACNDYDDYDVDVITPRSAEVRCGHKFNVWNIIEIPI